MLDISIISQDDISVGTNPCGSKSYVINLINFFSKQKILVRYFGTITNPTKKFDKNIHIYPISLKNISTFNFIFKLLISAHNLKINANSIIHAQKPMEMFPFIFFFKKNKKVLTLHVYYV